MDFGSLLHAAQKNDKTNKNEGNYYKTKFEPPKKENKSRTLSANIQKFLAKKEEEEKQKLEEAKRKRDDLLSMRDVKATNKIKKMLKVIKSANKSVLDDAVDNNNTAVTMAGPDQPDEDDYGYVSQEASAFYSKMMDKYKSIPEEDNKFASTKKVANFDLLSTKDRVKAAIIRHQEEEAMPHRRKRRSRNTGDSGRDSQSDYEDNVDEKKKEEEKKLEKPKPKRPAPPPLDFNELLKIAEKKQFEPVVIEKKVEKIEEPERLMTKKQKREYDQIKALKESKLRRERERENVSSDKELSRKRKPESPVSSKPVNPLSIRIPKIGEKLNKPNPVDTKRSTDSPNSSSSKSSERSKPSSDDKYRRDDSRGNERKSDASKNSKPGSNVSSHSKLPENHKSQSSNYPGARHLLKNKETVQRPEKNDLRNPLPEKQRNSSTNLNSSSTKVAPKLSSLPNNKISASKNTPRDVTPSSVNRGRPDQSSSNVSRGTSDSKGFNSTSNIRNERKPETQKQPMMKSSESSRIPNRPPLQKEQPKSLNSQSKQLPTSSSASKLGKRPIQEDTRLPKQGSSSGPSSAKQLKLSSDVQRSRPIPSADIKKARPFPPADVKGRPLPPADGKSRPFPPADVKSRPFPPADVKSRQFPPADVKSRQFPPSDVKSRQFPPADVKSRQFPPADVRGGKQFPPRDMMSRKEKPRTAKRQILDTDSEYDSEMDDFIDDDPQDDPNDYSKHIKEIFGYDKSRYRDADEDDRNMESNFSQVMREEYISKKIGIMEDLEDMRQEALEKKQKMQKKKRRILDD